MSRIFLVGYMGSGKTTVGKMLAKRLEYSFVDLDTHIEEKQFKTVSQIFAENGEQEFRLLEQKYLHEIAELDDVVISTGGGLSCFFNNMDYMNAHGVTIYLKLSATQLALRLKNSHTGIRPLLSDRKGAELLQFIEEGLTKREPFYSQAKIIVNGTNRNIVSQIRELI